MNKSILTTVCAAALSITANAGEAPMQAPVDTDLGEFFAGVDARDNAWYSYLGTNIALNGDIDSSGLFFHSFNGYGEYNYDLPGSNIEAALQEYDLGIGYQWVNASIGKVSIIGAGTYQDHDLSPNDPVNPVNGEEWGFKSKVDAWLTAQEGMLYGFTGSYSTAYDSYWTRAVIAKDFGCMHIGPEAIALGNQEFQENRLGLTVGGLSFGPAELSASVGYSWSDADSSNNDEESVYGNVRVALRF